MERIVSGGLVALTGCILIALFVALANTRFDPCFEPPLSQWTPHIASLANAPSPTPAPPRALVTVKIQADESDLEIDWADSY